jgi:hypothetical protein
MQDAAPSAGSVKHSTQVGRVSRGVSAGGPWLLFAGILIWGWRTTDLFQTVPSYGDVLEGLWATTWYAEMLSAGRSSAVYPQAFFPAGWHVATYAWGPANFVLLLPLYAIGGAAFAYNVATLITFGLAFAGMLALADRFVSRLAATVVALLYTFWGFRWYNIIGQLNIGLGSALLPWMIWSLERGLESPERGWRWCALAGALWAVSISSSPYFLWIGGILMVGWLVGRLGKIGGSRRSWLNLLLVFAVAGLLSLPAMLTLWQASQATGAAYFSIYEINQLGANASSLALPDTEHPWLGSLVRAIYRGDSGESFVGLGLLACLMAIFGFFHAVKMRARWRPVLVVGALGLILSLGLTLLWNDIPVRQAFLRPVNQAIWLLGYRLKPDLFLAPQPPAPFDDAVPMPGLLLAAVVPFFERARVLSRYALLAGIAVFLLAGLGLDRMRVSWLRWVIAALLIIEVLPAPTSSYAFPPPSHPAFEWLRQQSTESEGIAEFSTDMVDRLALPMGGSTIWATREHLKSTLSGASSVIPAHVVFLQNWLSEHFHPFRDPDFPILLHQYQVKHVLLHMYGGSEQSNLNDAQSGDDFRLVGCFPPSSPAPVYDHTICVLELLPLASQPFNVLLGDGWSGPEAWGRWIDGVSARALWVAAKSAPYRFSIEVFPQCVPGRDQRVDIEVNGVQMMSHEWTDCEPWSAQFDIPADRVRPGANEVTLLAAYGARPIDVTNGETKDTRSLSLGVTRLQVEPVP